MAAQDDEKKQSLFDSCVEVKAIRSDLHVYMFDGNQTFLRKIYDWSDVQQRLLRWLGVITNSEPRTISPALFISGPQKSGKSAMLNVLLPSVFFMHQAAHRDRPFQADIVRVSCETMAVGDIVRFCDLIENEIRNLGMKVDLDVKDLTDRPISYMETFFDQLGAHFTARRRHCMILIDEVQRLFLGDDSVKVACALKHIFQPNPRTHSDRNRLCFRFALTGSGMVTAFRAFQCMPANGSRFLSDCTIIPISTVAPKDVLDLIKTDLSMILPKSDRTTALLSLPDVPPVLLCFYGELALEKPDLTVADIVDRQRAKMLDEFRSDMLPYLQFRDLVDADACARRVHIRDAADRKCPAALPPDRVFGADLELFRPFLTVPPNAPWGFARSTFSEFLVRAIDAQGKLGALPTLTAIKYSCVDDVLMKLLIMSLKVYDQVKKLNYAGPSGRQAVKFVTARNAEFLRDLPPECYDGTSKVYQAVSVRNLAANKGMVSDGIQCAETKKWFACSFWALFRCCVAHDPDWVKGTFSVEQLLAWMLAPSVRKLWES